MSLNQHLLVALSLVSCLFAFDEGYRPIFLDDLKLPLPGIIPTTPTTTTHTLSVKTKSVYHSLTQVTHPAGSHTDSVIFQASLLAPVTDVTWILVSFSHETRRHLSSYYFDCVTHTWAPSLSHHIPPHSAVMVNGRGHLIIAGGSSSETRHPNTAVTWVASPNEGAATWSYPPLHHGRSNSVFGIVNIGMVQVLVMAGGWDTTPSDLTESCEWLMVVGDHVVEEEDYQDWQACGALPYPATSTSSIVVTNHLFSILQDDQGQFNLWVFMWSKEAHAQSWIHAIKGLPQDFLGKSSVLYPKNDNLCVTGDALPHQEYCLMNGNGGSAFVWGPSGKHYDTSLIGALSNDALEDCFPSP